MTMAARPHNSLPTPLPRMASAPASAAYPTPSLAATAVTGSLLRSLAVSALEYSPRSAAFFAERALALEPLSEPSNCLLAQCYLAVDSPHEALWLLRQPVLVFDPPQPPDRQQHSYQQPVASRRPLAATTSSGRLIRPANECSVRCARLYGEVCRRLRRDQEGRQVLANISRSGTVLAPPVPFDNPDLIAAMPRIDDAVAIQLEMGRLAQRAGEHERAIQSFTYVVSRVPTCWEALEGLCELGAPPNIDSILPATDGIVQRAAQAATVPHGLEEAGTVPVQPYLHSPSPLTPSQTLVLNAPSDYVHNTRQRQEGAGLITPVEIGVKVGDAVEFPNKGKGREVAGFPPPLRRAPVGRAAHYVSNMSHDDSFDTTFYPATGTLTFAPLQGSAPVPSHADMLATNAADLGRLAPAATGVKRTRAGTLAPASAHLSNLATAAREDDDTRTSSKRTVRGDGKPRRAEAIAGASGAGTTTRRSTRLSGAVPTQNAIGASMAVTRSQSSSGARPASQPRDKKRSKAALGPTVLSDNSSDPMHSLSSSPVPPSPGRVGPTVSLDQAGAALLREEAERYAAFVCRHFALTLAAVSTRSRLSVSEALAVLPVEQAQSVLAVTLQAKSHFDAMQYAKAATCFEQVRQMAPHRLDGMDVFSTSLWHLRQPTELSYLAQDLLAIYPRHAAAWIASGNVYSNAEDHPAALRCFRRAAQLDEDCVYAYTLSGHECVVLEEWERALGFFREAIRRDSQHYNAWFGLGNVYLKTGKHALAEYHFRKALELNPANATLACCVGTVLEKLGRREEALSLYDHAKAVAPESALARFKSVRLLVRLKRHEAAEADLLALQHEAPTEPNVLYLLGQLYRNLNRRPEMLRMFAQAQDLEPRIAGLVRQQIELEGTPGMEMDDSSEATSVAGE